MSGITYAVTYNGLRIGAVGKLDRGPVKARWLALSIHGEQSARFRTREEAKAWIVTIHRQTLG